MSVILNEVANWKLEAANEDIERYFYSPDVFRQIASGERCFVIGRKGTGKTAICQHLENNDHFSKFVVRLSLKSVPFNLLYQLEDTTFTRPSQYSSLWQYLILLSVVKLMAGNESIDTALSADLRRLFPQDAAAAFSDKIQQWTKYNFGVNVLGVGGQAGRDRSFTKITDVWHDLIEILQKIVLENIDGSEYYILFDELDEDYKNYWDEENHSRYISLLTSLFKAVSSLRRVFRQRGAKVKIIVMLRDDIYDLIRDPDRNKWEDDIIRITWRKSELKELLAHRISRSASADAEIQPYKIAEGQFFSQIEIPSGNHNKNIVSPFEYIYARTHGRPRDFIKYFVDCAESSIRQGHSRVNLVTLKAMEQSFSEHLRRELVDEVHSAFPDIDNLLNWIGGYQKPRFSDQEFLKLIEDFQKSPECSSEGKSLAPHITAKLLFHFSIIGNASRHTENRPIFKFESPARTYASNQSVVIHRGLLRSLGILRPA